MEENKSKRNLLTLDQKSMTQNTNNPFRPTTPNISTIHFNKQANSSAQGNKCFTNNRI